MKPLRRMRLPHALGHGDCMRIIHAVRHPVYRNCLLMTYSCGLRLGEAVRIQVNHIDKPTSILTITGKYNRQRLVPIPPTTLQALRDPRVRLFRESCIQ
jgi:integrase/recombinase XerD